MLFHKQEHLSIQGINKGSCYPTVIACLLDLPLNEVPYFNLFYYTQEEKDNLVKVFTHKYLSGDVDLDEKYKQGNFDRELSIALNHWWNTLNYFLAMKGYIIKLIPKDVFDVWVAENKDTPYMVTGKSSRGVNHIVIYVNGKLVHDPHPSNEGLVELLGEPYEILVKV